ncbi:hypothetical protein BdWA1_001134 [Babesia duncani]|uniref:Uncharacterized protein n=1 Tax=Babesia duncani TaxID=323732 RepID=A0AAD9UQR4_9APIC|nr:hypothetical protein BdWA1_003575 [Babesia duncani]KAK2198129.1 hypothetical protein BdWA1_001134 [Babesia duncani]
MQGLAVFVFLTQALNLVAGDQVPSIILSSRSIEANMTCTRFLDRFKKEQEDLLILVSISDMQAKPAFDESLSAKLHLDNYQKVEDNCTVFNQVLADLAKNVWIKRAKSLDSLDIAKSGLWIFDAPFDALAIDKLGTVATKVLPNRHVTIIVSNCQIRTPVSAGKVHEANKRIEKVGKQEILMTPAMLQHLMITGVFVSIALVGFMWAFSIRIPESLLNPQGPAKARIN